MINKKTNANTSTIFSEIKLANEDTPNYF